MSICTHTSYEIERCCCYCRVPSKSWCKSQALESHFNVASAAFILCLLTDGAFISHADGTDVNKQKILAHLLTARVDAQTSLELALSTTVIAQEASESGAAQVVTDLDLLQVRSYKHA